jgi:hypothetical protein
MYVLLLPQASAHRKLKITFLRACTPPSLVRALSKRLCACVRACVRARVRQDTCKCVYPVTWSGNLLVATNSEIKSMSIHVLHTLIPTLLQKMYMLVFVHACWNSASTVAWKSNLKIVSLHTKNHLTRGFWNLCVCVRAYVCVCVCVRAHCACLDLVRFTHGNKIFTFPEHTLRNTWTKNRHIDLCMIHEGVMCILYVGAESVCVPGHKLTTDVYVCIDLHTCSCACGSSTWITCVHTFIDVCANTCMHMHMYRSHFHALSPSIMQKHTYGQNNPNKYICKPKAREAVGLHGVRTSLYVCHLYSPLFPSGKNSLWPRHFLSGYFSAESLKVAKGVSSSAFEIVISPMQYCRTTFNFSLEDHVGVHTCGENPLSPTFFFFTRNDMIRTCTQNLAWVQHGTQDDIYTPIHACDLHAWLKTKQITYMSAHSDEKESHWHRTRTIFKRDWDKFRKFYVATWFPLSLYFRSVLHISREGAKPGGLQLRTKTWKRSSAQTQGCWDSSPLCEKAVGIVDGDQ